MDPRGPRCTQHPGAAAGFACGTCQKLLCPDCAAVRAAGHGQLILCRMCGGLAPAIRERRAVLTPFSSTLPGALRWPFTREAAVTLFACAFVAWACAWIGGIAALVADGVILAYLFHVVRHTAKGHDDFPRPDDFRGFFEDVMGPLIRALVASVWAWGPMVAWLFHTRGLGFVLDAHDLGASALPLLLLASGTFLFPMALLAGSLQVPIIHLLNPLLIVGNVVRLGRDYLLLAALAVLASVSSSLLLGALQLLDKVVALPDLLFYFVLLFIPVILFRAIGLLVRARGDELGYGGEDSYLDPVLGNVQPAHVLQAAQHDALLGSAAALPAVAAAPPSRDAVEHAGALPVSIDLPSGDELPAPLLVARAITEGDLGAAARTLARGGQVPAQTLSAQAWVQLGKHCEAEGQARLALLALRRAVEVAPEGPLAPQAWLLAARIYDEKLGNKPVSDQLLGELLRRHPQTAEAAFALLRLQER